MADIMHIHSTNANENQLKQNFNQWLMNKCIADTTKKNTRMTAVSLKHIKTKKRLNDSFIMKINLFGRISECESLTLSVQCAGLQQSYGIRTTLC